MHTSRFPYRTAGHNSRKTVYALEQNKGHKRLMIDEDLREYDEMAIEEAIEQFSASNGYNLIIA